MVFFPKKAKAKMRERRRKMMKANDNNDNGATTGYDNDHQNEHESTANNNDDVRNSNQRKRKRAADQMISNGEHPSSPSSSDMIHKKAKSDNKQYPPITIPANLTSKEAKKFRKDERRKARSQGQSENSIKFIIEGQTQPEEEDHDNNNDEPSSKEEDKKSNNNKKPKKEFPRINDLLTQHATHKAQTLKLAKQKSINASLPPSETSRYIAIDCEMVGIGPDGKKSALARASAVDWDGNILLDTFVRVPERVTDFRTHVSGVRPKNIGITNETAMDHEECRTRIGQLLSQPNNKILVGHALKNDLSALMLTHPKSDIRDTARYKPLMRSSGRSGGKLRPRKLRDLVYEHVGLRIQVEGEAHCSVDDARASMELFKVVRGGWEKELLLAGKKKKKGGGGVSSMGKK